MNEEDKHRLVLKRIDEDRERRQRLEKLSAEESRKLTGEADTKDWVEKLMSAEDN